MQKFFFIVPFLCLISFNQFVYSQIYIGNTKYNSTETYYFTQDGGGLQSFSPLEVTIGKNGSKGLLMLSMPSLEGKLRKAVTIYLDDGSRIYCSDRNLFDEVNDQTIGIWYLTSTEVEKMKYSNIKTIRYTILYLGIEYKSYTASNYYNYQLMNKEVTWQTSLDIIKLFKY